MCVGVGEGECVGRRASNLDRVHTIQNRLRGRLPATERRNGAPCSPESCQVVRSNCQREILPS